MAGIADFIGAVSDFLADSVSHHALAAAYRVALVYRGAYSVQGIALDRFSLSPWLL
jgi:hypothetical protein